MGSCHAVPDPAGAIMKEVGVERGGGDGGTQRRQQPPIDEGAEEAQVRKGQEENNEPAAHRGTPLGKQDVLDSLRPCQRCAIIYVDREAQPAHKKALPELEQRVKGLGYNIEDLHRCLAYIRDDAPIIIHLTEATLKLLNEDTHYRNLFETKTSAGKASTSLREKWERCLFGNHYNDVDGALRPKYGCLNICGDIAGNRVARAYGKLYLVLARHVRYRATFSDDDTGNNPLSAKDLSTNDCYANVLSQYSDTDLKAALNVSRIGGSACDCDTYKEVQIHGPVCLATDIEALSIPGREAKASKKLKAAVAAFQKKTNCNVLWQGDLSGSDIIGAKGQDASKKSAT